MSLHEPVHDDRFLPPAPEPVGVGRVVRWVAVLVALGALAALAYGAYAWLAGNVSQRGTGTADTPADATAVAAGGMASDVTLAPSVPTASSAAPSVAPGAVAIPAPVETPAAAVADLGAIADPDQRRSVCNYLTAELARLDYEFVQPLPPPVIDRIATEVTQLRAQAGRHDCTPNAQGGLQGDPQGANAEAPAAIVPVEVASAPERQRAETPPPAQAPAE